MSAWRQSLRSVRVDRIAGALVAASGAWILWQALQFREGPGFAVVGPRVFPAIVGLGLLSSGIALALLPRGEVDPAPATDWRTLLLMAAVLAAYLVLYLPLGFPIASVAFLVAGAWVLGSRAPLRDLVAGGLLVIVVYLLFTRLLGIDLPAGPLQPLI